VAKGYSGSLRLTPSSAESAAAGCPASRSRRASANARSADVGAGSELAGGRATELGAGVRARRISSVSQVEATATPMSAKRSTHAVPNAARDHPASGPPSRSSPARAVETTGGRGARFTSGAGSSGFRLDPFFFEDALGLDHPLAGGLEAPLRLGVRGIVQEHAPERERRLARLALTEESVPLEKELADLLVLAEGHGVGPLSGIGPTDSRDTSDASRNN
jgi:hypothetical protein